MKRLIILLMLLALMLTGSSVVTGQEQDQKVKEWISVQNVEIIIRAMQRGKALSGLKESDFTLLENGKTMKITSLTEVRRKIGSNKIQMEVGEKDEKPGKPRLFLLYFWVYEPELRFNQILNSFFQDIYREGDIVFLAFRDSMFKIQSKKEIPSKLGELKKKINLYTYQANLAKKDIFTKLDELCEAYIEGLSTGIGPSIDDLAMNYYVHWNSYKYKHLVLRIRQLLDLAESLKKIQGEKWSLIFYQNHTFPQLDPMGEISYRQSDNDSASHVQKMFQKIAREMNTPVFSGQHLRQIREAFVSANTTFHFLRMNSVTKHRFQSRSLREINVVSDWQVSFRDIAKVTGGETMAGNRFPKFINKVIENEDIYYRLTYSPQELDKNKRKIVVKTHIPQTQIYYNRLVDLKPVEALSISNLSFTEPNLTFSLKDYRLIYDEDHMAGQVEIKVVLVDKRGKGLTFNKTLILTEKESQVSLKLNFPQPGQYKVAVTAIDKISGVQAFTEQRIRSLLAKKEAKLDQDELTTILFKTGQYCEKLKKIIFHFYCHERVTEVIDRSFQFPADRQDMKDFFEEGNRRSTSSYFRQRNYDPKKRSTKNTYIYDYQIIKDSDRIKEQRILINENGKKRRQVNPAMKTVLYSFKNVITPIMLLAQENQNKYSYNLEDEKRIMGQDAYIISVISKTGIKLATVWVDKEDYSILKFDVFPQAIKGYDRLLRINRNKMTNLVIKDSHVFGHLHKGIRYPSKTDITISFNTQSPGKTNVTDSGYIRSSSFGKEVHIKINTVIRYKKYKFFDVSVNTAFKDLDG